MNIDEKILAKIKALEGDVERLKRLPVNPKFYPLKDAPLTSTDWDGDSHSTTAKTKIDLSAVFGVPAKVKAVLALVVIRDSGSSSGDPNIVLGPTNDSNVGMALRCGGLANDSLTSGSMIVPCDGNGDIYFQNNASGTNTMDIWLQIWGYWK